MIRRSLLRGALLASALLASSGAFAQSLVGGTVLNGGVPSYNVNATAPFTIDQGTLALRVFVVNGTGGGGGGGSSGPSYVGQYNSTLPTFTSGQTGYLSVDSNGRLILAPVGVAQDATLTARLGTLGQKTMAASTPVVIASDQGPLGVTVGPYGLGAMSAVPGASSTGTPLSASPPAGKRGARLYVPPGASITFTVASAQPSSAPSATITVSNPSANTIPTNWDEDLNGQMIYVTAVTGSPLFRWY